MPLNYISDATNISLFYIFLESSLTLLDFHTDDYWILKLGISFTM